MGQRESSPAGHLGLSTGRPASQSRSLTLVLQLDPHLPSLPPLALLATHQRRIPVPAPLVPRAGDVLPAAARSCHGLLLCLASPSAVKCRPRPDPSGPAMAAPPCCRGPAAKSRLRHPGERRVERQQLLLASSTSTGAVPWTSATSPE